MRNKLAARSSTSTATQGQKEAERETTSQDVCQLEDTDAAKDGLFWNEARRICSEPAELIRRTSAVSEYSIPCSLACNECEEYDDVFVLEKDEELQESRSWEVERKIALEGMQLACIYCTLK